MSSASGNTTIYTIGHSTRPIDELIDLLSRHGVEVLVDVRSVPRSRRNPQFEQHALRRSLESAGIAYRLMQRLGGLRRPAADSINSGWRNESFRGYADYMQTDAFAEALDELIELGTRQRAAVMCAEAVPWRCHRSLIADALLVRGFSVTDIIDGKSARAHALTPFARVEGTRITYPPEA